MLNPHFKLLVLIKVSCCINMEKKAWCLLFAFSLNILGSSGVPRMALCCSMNASHGDTLRWWGYSRVNLFELFGLTGSRDGQTLSASASNWATCKCTVLQKSSILILEFVDYCGFNWISCRNCRFMRSLILLCLSISLISFDTMKHQT